MLTETSFLMVVAKDILAQTATIYMPLITIISIIIAGFTAYYSAKMTSKNTEMTLKTTTQNLITQMNQVEITKSIKKLYEEVESGEVERIERSMDSDEGLIYIPASLKKEIKEILYLFSIDKGLENDLNKMDGQGIPEKLKKKFENRKISLPTNLIVTKKGAKWEITDNKKEKIHYTIRRAKWEITDNKKEKIHNSIRKKKRKLNIYLNGELDSDRISVILDLINKYISP